MDFFPRFFAPVQYSSRFLTRRTTNAEDSRPRCGLCGKIKNLTKTKCCSNWICDDIHKYVMFSFARNSCYRNHERYTLCAYHYNEDHTGRWQTCRRCRNDFETEIYVDYGTNPSNFEKLPNPPSFPPTKCSQCGEVIIRANGGYTMDPSRGFFCGVCQPQSSRIYVPLSP